MRATTASVSSKSSAPLPFGYAVYHEFGTKRMPRRGLLYIDPRQGQLSGYDEVTVLDLLTEWLEKAGS